MKYILKKYWIHIVFILIIYIPIIVITTTRTNYSLILKGDTTKFNSVVDIDTDYIEEGSFSTIYVISMDKSTVFQNLITAGLPTVEKYKMSTSYTHLSDIETYKAGKIDYYSSIEIAIINAYTYAKLDDDSINIDYKFKSFDVTWYKKDSQFKIGDEIIGINDISNDSEIGLYNGLRALKDQDTIHIIRNNKPLDIIWQKNIDSVSITKRYEINYDTIFPKLKIKDTNVGGPSGGLLQTLSIYNKLTKDDLTHGKKIAGTGTINSDGSVGEIGGIREKIPTALDDNIDVFFCPKGNYNDAKEAYDFLNGRSKMQLIEIDNFKDAIKYLKELK